MTTDSRPADRDRDHDRETPDSATDRVHDTSWSANLELPRHAADRNLVISEAVAAVEHTTAGHHVNLVTHGDHGHPETYLYDALAERLGEDVAYEYVERCGCGGHVTRVYVE
ncbi:CGCGG family putative rSAM-modified RiPP protein [Haloferax sulfurifontis]|uniref:CGCGG family rSAM-modified RiPP protein n=1 Tax=Haloferax sulfurifontis ATCC BAA-897 TaxID=662480 RepID=M0HXY9_9EURY|nr:CGCGG family rSAM-modified RiPP protein [Haloferax sulfurifontis]ELZ89371.1 hypothetical protein C441_15839 [Haloferax sulfurifontis ATCC BAA-897]